MERVFLFFAIVIIGVLGILAISNQANKPKEILKNMDKLPPVIDTITPLPTVTPVPSPTPTISVSSNSSTDSAQTNEQTATIRTSKGNIVLTLYSKDAPRTVENFINKAKSGFYDNLTFHRVEDWVIQGGDPKGDGTGGGNMPTELNSKPFVVGSLGVARGGDIKVSNDAQFFITKTDSSHLNNQYTNFGMVKEGLDVVNKIEIGDKILEITIK